MHKLYMWLLVLTWCCYAQCATRVVVTFHTRALAERDWPNITAVARVERQYGRRLVLEFERKVNMTTDAPRIVTAIGAEHIVWVEPCERMTSEAVVWDKADINPYSTHAEGAWRAGNLGDSSVVVAVLDSGLSVAGRQFLSHHVSGYDFTSYVSISNDGDGADPDPTDPGGQGPTCPTPSWHGTCCASVLAANGTLGVRGVAPNITVLSVRISGACGTGYSDDLARGIVWAAGGYLPGIPNNTRPANIISISFGAYTPAACPSFLNSSIRDARALGSVVVVSAGNNADNASARWPCNCAGVVCVAATNYDGDLASYSNRGDPVAFAAPGGDSAVPIPMLSCNDPNGTSLYMRGWSGTSFAAPNAVGMMALQWANRSTGLAIMPVASGVVGVGAGMLTNVNTLPPAPASGPAGAPRPNCTPGYYLNPTKLECTVCDNGTHTASAPTLWGPTSFVVPSLHNSICTAVPGVERQQQYVYNCGGILYLFWSSSQWWYGGAWDTDEYWGAATPEAPMSYLLGEPQPALLLLQVLGVQAVSYCPPQCVNGSAGCGDTTTFTTTAVHANTQSMAFTTAPVVSTAIMQEPASSTSALVDTSTAIMQEPASSTTALVDTSTAIMQEPASSTTALVDTSTIARQPASFTSAQDSLTTTQELTSSTTAAELTAMQEPASLTIALNMSATMQEPAALTIGFNFSVSMQEPAVLTTTQQPASLTAAQEPSIALITTPTTTQEPAPPTTVQQQQQQPTAAESYTTPQTQTFTSEPMVVTTTTLVQQQQNTPQQESTSQAQQDIASSKETTVVATTIINKNNNSTLTTTHAANTTTTTRATTEAPATTEALNQWVIAGIAAGGGVIVVIAGYTTLHVLLLSGPHAAGYNAIPIMNA